MSDGYVGSALYLKFGSTVLNTNFRSFTMNEDTDMVDSSAGADTFRSFLATLTTGTSELSFVIPAGTAGSAMIAAVARGTSGTIEAGPEGTTSGKNKFTVPALVKSRALEFPYDDVCVCNVSFQGTGVVVQGSY